MPIFRKHSLVFPVLVLLVSMCVGTGVVLIYNVLGKASIYFDARTNSWITDLKRTNSHLTNYQEKARAYFLNPTGVKKQ